MKKLKMFVICCFAHLSFANAMEYKVSVIYPMGVGKSDVKDWAFNTSTSKTKNRIPLVQSHVNRPVC